MRTPLNALVTEKVLHLISVRRASDLFDLVAEGQIENNIELKNVCAKVSPQLSGDIDEICGLLNISKRRFLEAAMIDAVAKARLIIQREELEDVLTELELDAEAYDASRALDSNEG